MSDLTWSGLATGQATIVETRKRDGSWVSTPVTVVSSGSVAYFLTEATSGKAKRLRNFPEVRVAAATVQGKPTGPLHGAVARRLEGEEFAKALAAIRRAHPIIFGVIIRFRYWTRRNQPAVYELSELHALN